jgi:hypothetical protein
MTTKEHLDKIVAKIDQLLELAEKRTQGKWYASEFGPIATLEDPFANGVWYIAYTSTECHEGNANKPFIAACAGPAEAGWRATKAAIEQATWLVEIDSQGRISLQDQGATHRMIQEIIAAWPEELL